MQWQKLLRESILIVFSVLLALFINEIIAKNKDKRNTKVLLENLKTELETNLATADFVRDYHDRVRDSLIVIIDQGLEKERLYNDHGLYIYDVADRGIIQESVTEIAWQVSKQQGLSSKINFETSSLLYDVYEQQRLVMTTLDNIIMLMNDRVSQDQTQAKTTVFLLTSFFKEAVGQEKVLIKKYKKTLALLEKEIESI